MRLLVRTFLLAELYRVWSWGSQTCRIGLGFEPCPCTHPRSESQGKGYQCPCRGAGALSVLHFELVVIEVVHQMLGEVQNAHVHIYRAIEY